MTLGDKDILDAVLDSLDHVAHDVADEGFECRSHADSVRRAATPEDSTQDSTCSRVEHVSP